jgi:hypothetical protein
MPSTSSDVGPPSLAIDLVVEGTTDIGDALLAAALRDVQRDHITVTRLLNVELADTRGDNLEVDEVIPAVLDGRKLRAPDDASYTVLLTNRSVSHRSSKPPRQNMFYFAHDRFGLLSVRNLDHEVLRQLIADIRPGERAELLRKYLAAFIPLTAVLGQAAARGKPILPKRGPDVDTGCLSDFNNQLDLLIYKLKTGPEICPQEYKDIANAFGQTVADEFNAILQRIAKKETF